MKWISRTILPLIASSLVLLILESAAQAQDPAERGRSLLTEFCSRCHAIRNTDKSRNRLAPLFRTLGRSVDLDQFARQIERGISSSHPDMPEIKFSSDEARAVAAYLRSIQQ
jgi:mono/diheme cytochrome c family protein